MMKERNWEFTVEDFRIQHDENIEVTYVNGGFHEWWYPRMDGFSSGTS